MRKFVLNIALFLILFSVVYLVFMSQVEKTLRSSNYIDFTEWNAIFDGEINASTIILGSSRARKMVDPEIMTTVTNSPTYNLGFEGYKLPFQITKYKIYRKYNSKPKRVVQIVDHFTLQARPDLFNIEQFLPYLKDSTIKAQTSNYKGFTWGDYNIPYFRYFGKSNFIIAGAIEKLNIKKFESAGKMGYYPKNTNIWETSFEREKITNPTGEYSDVNSAVYDSLLTLISALKKDSIYHYIVYAPEFYEFHSYIKNRDSISNLYRTAAATSSFCVYIDYKDSSICKDRKNFYNPTHLNKTAAEQFTRSLSVYINSLKTSYE